MNTHLNQTYSVPSPAKLNLFLHIVGQRDDGYHELETLFQFLDHCDTIEITVTNDSAIELLTPLKGVNDEDNLIVKAACLLQNKMRESGKRKHELFGAKISIKKILPMGGGLGGGSSNAATILVALNTLWQCHLSNRVLAQLGLSLGADVPIFIHGLSSFAQGIGEKLTATSPTEYWYLVTKPKCSISTQRVFTAAELPRNTPRIHNIDSMSNVLTNDLFRNDCQTMVIKHYSEVAKLLAWLVEYAPSRMTGTGACIFSHFSNKEQAYDLQAKLPKGISSFVAKGLNISPLNSVIEQIKKCSKQIILN